MFLPCFRSSSNRIIPSPSGRRKLASTMSSSCILANIFRAPLQVEVLTLWNSLLSSRWHTKSEYMGGLNDDYSAHRSASFLAKATISRPCVNTTFTADCISLSAMASLWTASYNIANGYSAFINIHELLRWCTHPSIAFISLASALCTSFMSACVVAASFSSVCRLLPKASSGERSMWLTCFCPMLYSVQ